MRFRRQQAFAKRMSAAAFLVLLTLAVPVIGAAQSGATVLLVRHAEKVSNAADAALSDLGKERAERLAQILADAGVSAIYTTEVQRTQQTAAPLAKRLKIEPTVIAAKDIDVLLKKLQTLADGAVVLVVGHSNTLPLIMAKLLEKSPAAPSENFLPAMKVGDADYDRLFVVSLNGPSHAGARPNAKLLVLHY